MSYMTGADTLVCHKCGKSGHVRRRCREKEEPGKGRTQKEEPGKGRTTPFHCFRCGDPDHRVSACKLLDVEAAKVSPQSRGWKVYECEHCKQTLQSKPPVNHLSRWCPEKPADFRRKDTVRSELEAMREELAALKGMGGFGVSA